MPFNGCFYGCFQTASTFKCLCKRVKMRGRQGMRTKHVSTSCSPHSAVVLPTALPCCAQEQSLPILLGPKLYSNKERMAKWRQHYINHSASVETPIILFPMTRDNLCGFCFAHFFDSFSFVFRCWPCTKKYNLTSCVFSAKKVSVPGLNVSCTQIKGKKHKSWHILFISWFTSMMLLSILFCYYCWCFAHNVALTSQKCLSPTDKYSY